jgi:hypothetical protein
LHRTILIGGANAGIKGNGHSIVSSVHVRSAGGHCGIG